MQWDKVNEAIYLPFFFLCYNVTRQKETKKKKDAAQDHSISKRSRCSTSEGGWHQCAELARGMNSYFRHEIRNSILSTQDVSRRNIPTRSQNVAYVQKGRSIAMKNLHVTDCYEQDRLQTVTFTDKVSTPQARQISKLRSIARSTIYLPLIGSNTINKRAKKEKSHCFFLQEKNQKKISHR